VDGAQQTTVLTATTNLPTMKNFGFADVSATPIGYRNKLFQNERKYKLKSNLKLNERLVLAWRILLGRPAPWEHGPKFQKRNQPTLPKGMTRDSKGRWIEIE